MVETKYYNRLRYLQSDNNPLPAAFNFNDIADDSLAGKTLLRLFDHPQLFTKVLRSFFPILKLGQLVIVSRFDDVKEILATDSVFEVPFGLEMKEMSGGANFVLGMKSDQEGSDYERQKRFMDAAFLRDDVANFIGPLAARFANEILENSNGRLNAVSDLITLVPTRICEAYYGIPIIDEDAFADWALSLSVLFFADPLGKEKLRRLALSAAPRIQSIINKAIDLAKAGKVEGDTVLGRLIKLQHTDQDPPSDSEIRAILTGMITGFVPTNTVAGAHMLSILMEKPEALQKAKEAAHDGYDDGLWCILREAMRFRPLNFGPFRYCNKTHRLASGQVIEAGSTVLASTLSAMLDSRRVPNPDKFDPSRSRDQYLLFGYGMHACFGAMIAEAQITQTLKALLVRPGFRAVSGAEGKLARVGPIPRRLIVEFEPTLRASGKTATQAAFPIAERVEHANAPISQSLITICVPLDQGAAATALENEIKRLGNPANEEARKAFETAGCIHFASLSVIRGDDKEPTYAVLEMSADGSESDVIGAVAAGAGTLLRPIFEKGCGLKPGRDLATFLQEHALDVSYRKKAPGLLFCGTPGLTVQRIRLEEALEEKLTRLLDNNMARQRDGEALRVLNDVRAELRNEGGYDWAFHAEPTPFLATPDKPIAIPRIFLTWRILTGVGGLSLFTTILIWLAFSNGQQHSVTVHIISILASLLLGTELAFFVLLGLLGAIFFAFRRQEIANVPDDSDPDPVAVREIMEHENRVNQNHMTGVSLLKPGLLRNFTLRFMFFYVTRRLALFFRPGYLNEIGTIHFARWVLLPKTKKLLFFSNYSGSWESYMEDFITKASRGLTGVWSNTEGFPRTRFLLFNGSEDGDRFKRWARRQQIPTLFWYSAYPDLAPERIRVNAAIRDGFARARTESEAVAWRSLFGSQPRPPKILEDHEVQTLVFSGIGKLREAECLLVSLPDQNVEQARSWLDDYFSASRPISARITFGDVMPTERATFVALTSTGLTKLGLNADETSVSDSFPTAFIHGMNAPWRSRLLGDEGPNAPTNWQWGAPENSIDAAVIIYARDKAGLDDARNIELTNLERVGAKLVHRIETQLTFPRERNGSQQSTEAPYFRETPSVEAFGFADGISQPLIKGTRKWYEDQNDLHGVEPGEIILGYPDNRGYYPPTPQVTAKEDIKNDLPLTPPQLPARWPQFGGNWTRAPRDLGRNGSFLVIRQLEQLVVEFNTYLESMAVHLQAEWPDMPITASWLAAKMVGRWQDGTSLVRNPSGAERPVIDNDFLLGQDDPQGLKCPLGAHIRRANPRDSLRPGEKDQIAISNRHRIFRVGRPYIENTADGEKQTRGLLFMGINADIERQFEFIQQTWIDAPYFHGLGKENDPFIASVRHERTFTIPTHRGPITLRNLDTFVTVRGGAYFFLPSRSALRFMSRASHLL